MFSASPDRSNLAARAKTEFMKRSTASLEKAFRLFQTNQLSAALKECRAFLEVRPNNYDALQLCGAICSDLGRHADALRFFNRALGLQPRSAGAHHNLGNAQMAAGEVAAAQRSFEAGLQIEPTWPLLLCASANALTEMQRYDEALAQFESAIAIDAHFADAHYGLGRLLMLKSAFATAKAAFLRAAELDGSDRGARLNAFNCGLEVADWQDYAQLHAASRSAALAGTGKNAFGSLLLFDDSKIHFCCAKTALEVRGTPRPLPPTPHRAGSRIRIAYFSSDFREHPTSRLLVGLIEQHDRDAFEVVGFSMAAARPARQAPFRNEYAKPSILLSTCRKRARTLSETLRRNLT